MFKELDKTIETFFTQADEFVEKSKQVEEVDEQFPSYLSDVFKGLVKW